MSTIPFGSNLSLTLQSKAIFAAVQQKMTKISQMSEPFPSEKDARKKIKLQTSSHYPVVVCRDLAKSPGDEITFDLINPMQGIPIMGDAYAEGRGQKMTFSQDRLRIQQARFPIFAGSTMDQQRTTHDLQKLARAQAEIYMPKLEDQLSMVHMAGARGFHDNIEWNVPLASHDDFEKVCVNTVKAPTKNRHFISTATGIEPVVASGNEITIATTDLLTLDVIEAIGSYVDSMALPIAPCKFKGDVMAADSPLRVLWVSPQQYASVRADGNFRQLQSQALARASKAGGSPIFTGEVGLWDNTLVMKIHKPIRFYAGDAINWCESYLTETETTDDLVPAAFGTTHAVDRALLIGAQALAHAYGGYKKTSSPYFWSEKDMDHGDKLEFLIGMIAGMSKMRFLIDHGGADPEYTDYGVMAIDTAVALP